MPQAWWRCHRRHPDSNIIADRVGSLEVGKDGDLALYDGDPFEYTSHCVAVVIDGQVVSDEKR